MPCDRYINTLSDYRLNRLFNPPSWYPKRCRVPGWIGDNTHRCLRKFDKWYARPIRAHRLYWRLHNKNEL